MRPIVYVHFLFFTHKSKSNKFFFKCSVNYCLCTSSDWHTYSIIHMYTYIHIIKADCIYVYRSNTKNGFPFGLYGFKNIVKRKPCNFVNSQKKLIFKGGNPGFRWIYYEIEFARGLMKSQGPRRGKFKSAEHYYGKLLFFVTSRTLRNRHALSCIILRFFKRECNSFVGYILKIRIRSQSGICTHILSHLKTRPNFKEQKPYDIKNI